MRRTGRHHTPESLKGQDGRRPDRRLGRSRRLLALGGTLTTALLAGASLAAAGALAPAKSPPPPDPPAPTIGARPADPTNVTSAHFTYADSQSGVSFQCQLDGAAFASCPVGGITYAGPLAQGQHNFKVRAVSGAKTSTVSTASWTVDTLAPAASISYPTDGLTLGSGDWGARCPARAAICGAATDAHGVSTVLLSIQRNGGGWWGGSAFDQQSESFRTATLTSSYRDSTRWSYALRLPADGVYTVHVRAIDYAGNTTPATSQASGQFTVDTTPPPSPVIATRPEATTTSRSATFAFTDSEHGARFICSRDGARFTACTTPKSYGSLALGQHRFEVQAADAAGNASAPTGYSWTVVKTIESGKAFTVAGDASGPLAPGVSRSLAVTLTNPNPVAIEVTSLTVGVASGSSKAGCDGPSNLTLTQSSVSSANVLKVPANGHVVLPTAAVSAPSVLMRDLPTNQDVCKGASFTFSYSGSAHS
jgi:hypothetical protein